MESDMTDDIEILPAWNAEPLADAIVCRACSDGWFTIERAEHDDKMWTEGTSERGWSDNHIVAASSPGRTYMPNVGYCCYSGRLERTTDVEGAASDVLALADALERGADADLYRCACHFEDGGTVLLWSPRNSQTATRISGESARDLAASIREAVNPKASTEAP